MCKTECWLKWLVFGLVIIRIRFLLETIRLLLRAGIKVVDEWQISLGYVRGSNIYVRGSNIYVRGYLDYVPGLYDYVRR